MPVLILAALLVIWSINSLFPVLRNKFEAWQVKRAYEKLAEPYYKDTYGGKTPEETYYMFIAALKKGDTDLASKYFVVERQDNWAKTLEEYKTNNSLSGFIKELEDTRKIWEKTKESSETTVSFEYQTLIEKGSKATIGGQEVEIPAGNYTNESIFSKYPTGIWKIESL